MINAANARSAVQAILDEMPPISVDDSWVIADEFTIEEDWGWVFFYNSRRFRETGDSEYLVAGNAPYIVRRSDGEVLLTGTAFPIKAYIQAYQDEGKLP